MAKNREPKIVYYSTPDFSERDRQFHASLSREVPEGYLFKGAKWRVEHEYEIDPVFERITTMSQREVSAVEDGDGMRVEYHRHDFTMAFASLAPLVTEAFAYAKSGRQEEALDALGRAADVVRVATKLQVKSPGLLDASEWARRQRMKRGLVATPPPPEK